MPQQRRGREEGLRAVLGGPDEDSSGDGVEGRPAAAPSDFSRALCAPVLELVDRPALHAGDFPVVRVRSPAGAPFTVALGDMMPKAKKRKAPKKRGPKEERLIITEHPEMALSRLLKPPRKGQK